MEKIALSLIQTMRSQPREAKIAVIVGYRREMAVRKGLPQRLVAGVEPSRTFRLLPAAALSIPSQVIEELSRDPNVEMIWPDLPVHSCLDESVPLIRAPQVWNDGYTGKGVKVAIVDTGIDPYHPDFAGRIAAMVDFTGEGARDLDGHGTHVAGIVAGSGQASGGKYRGVAPESAIYSAKVLDSRGLGLMSDVMAGLEWAVEQEVDIINLSLGSDPPCDGTDALSLTCDLIVERGYVVCVAAGNAGPAPQTIGPPGCARQVITVGACTGENGVADFSSRGPTSDGRVKPDIVLPGVDIISCRAEETNMGRPVGEKYAEASGTSMATPHATGIAALLLQAKPGLTPSQVKSLLQETAIDLGFPANAQGGGRADAYQAYKAEPATPPPEEREGCLSSLLGLVLQRDRSKA